MNQFKGAIRDDESMKTRLAASVKEFVEENSLFEDVDENFKIYSSHQSECLALYTIYICSIIIST